MSTKSDAAEIVDRAIESAQRQWGRGWDMLTPVMRRAMVSNEVCVNFAFSPYPVNTAEQGQLMQETCQEIAGRDWDA